MARNEEERHRAQSKHHTQRRRKKKPKERRPTGRECRDLPRPPNWLPHIMGEIGEIRPEISHKTKGLAEHRIREAFWIHDEINKLNGRRFTGQTTELLS
ncbi:unnamed protein product [Prunus armeniaca]|uniref:Uncharacterized protein n=1 Tax=Prunus armeniaca TaxID=36596 RepID=A0A6J5Y6G7_PRUAR|nr:unnamed protein product [Prunus armeniaca]